MSPLLPGQNLRKQSITFGLQQANLGVSCVIRFNPGSLSIYRPHGSFSTWVAWCLSWLGMAGWRRVWRAYVEEWAT